MAYFGADKPIASITKGDATDFERFLKTEARENRYAGIAEDEGLSPDTVRKQFFTDAVDHELIGSNPFAHLKAAVKGNRSRDFFISREMAAQVLEQCPDAE